MSGNTTLKPLLRPLSPRSTLSTGRFATISTATHMATSTRRARRRRRTDAGGVGRRLSVWLRPQILRYPTDPLPQTLRKIHQNNQIRGIPILLCNSMTDPDELITGLFTLAVSILILVVFYQVYTGGSVARISELASALAVPFIFFLLLIYVLVTVLQNV